MDAATSLAIEISSTTTPLTITTIIRDFFLAVLKIKFKMSIPFVKTVCRAMENIAPLRLAEKWDNVSAFFLTFDFQPYLRIVKGWTITR